MRYIMELPPYLPILPLTTAADICNLMHTHLSKEGLENLVVQSDNSFHVWYPPERPIRWMISHQPVEVDKRAKFLDAVTQLLADPAVLPVAAVPELVAEYMG
jgi:hypothetical protein